ncbi:MAG: DGQHR domain-containing protein [Xenococcaceae cyanobacterium]
MENHSLNEITARKITTTFGDIPVHTFQLKVKEAVFIHYVAVRGQDHEEGAVQRILNKRRISSIRDYILEGNNFFNTFILNWTDKKNDPKIEEDSIKIPLVNSAAQVIDGQHRLAGFKAAITEDETVGERSILVSLCMKLKTQEAAKIFLNINSEQKPVPKSLIYDLFGEVIHDEQHAINRASDIADELNENPESPYYNSIKYPGRPGSRGKLDLSTVVSALKPHLEPEGVFKKLNLKNLNYQKNAVINYFKAIKYFYDKQKSWAVKNKNPFLKSSEFNGALDHLTDKLLYKCAEKKSFTVKTMKDFLGLDKEQLLTLDIIKSLDGKTARKKVKEYLDSHLIGELPGQDEYEF